jgi:hypothetical protein
VIEDLGTRPCSPLLEPAAGRRHARGILTAVMKLGDSPFETGNWVPSRGGLADRGWCIEPLPYRFAIEKRQLGEPEARWMGAHHCSYD